MHRGLQIEATASTCQPASTAQVSEQNVRLALGVPFSFLLHRSDRLFDSVGILLDCVVPSQLLEDMAVRRGKKRAWFGGPGRHSAQHS
jgi:hypothetical protein